MDCGYDDPSENTDKSLVDCDRCSGTAGCDDCGFTGCMPNPNMEWEPCPGPPMILFLDFDGVLHPMQCGAAGLFKQSSKIRELLVKYACLRLVVHSSWRFPYSEDEIWDFLEMEDSLRHRYLGVTPLSEQNRWESIRAWLKVHSYKGNYVILDDMFNSFDLEGQWHLISPPYDEGMRDQDWKELERRLDAHLRLPLP